MKTKKCKECGAEFDSCFLICEKCMKVKMDAIAAKPHDTWCHETRDDYADIQPHFGQVEGGYVMRPDEEEEEDE
jgi:hypothetical protein